METKAERITKLLGIIGNKSERIKKLKFKCGQQAIKICVLNLRIKELEAVIQKCIDAMKGSNCLEEQWLAEVLKG